jgi:hypothetical protein
MMLRSDVELAILVSISRTSLRRSEVYALAPRMTSSIRCRQKTSPFIIFLHAMIVFQKNDGTMALIRSAMDIFYNPFFTGARRESTDASIDDTETTQRVGSGISLGHLHRHVWLQLENRQHIIRGRPPGRRRIEPCDRSKDQANKPG